MLGNNKKSIGFNSNFYTNKSNFSAEALQWKANIINNGGTISDALLTIFDNNFFKPAKANGNILNQLDRLNIYCGLVGFEIAARTNMINANHFVTPVSSPTFDNNGYKTSGTSYLNLNYNPFVDGVKLLTNDAHFGCVVKAPQFTANKFTMGCQNGVQTQILRLRRQLLEFNGVTNSGNGTSTVAAASSNNVFLAGRRTASTTAAILIDGTSIADTNASSARPNLTMFELTYNAGGSPIGGYDDNYHLASWCGSSSLDYTNFRTILNNLYTALGL
jgi:hypothetical protein